MSSCRATNGNPSEAVCELARLALAYIDSTRARRVGEAVLNVLYADPFGAESLVDGDHTPLHESGAVDEILSAIAAALRGEP